VDYFGGFVSFINRGGPAMYGLLLCSIAAVAIVIERLVFFAQQHGNSKELLRQIGAKISQDDITGAIKVCRQNKGMLPNILAGTKTEPTSQMRSP
jgi:biopolymer transport protein ExbB